MTQFFSLSLICGLVVLVCSLAIFASQGSEFDNQNINNIEHSSKDQEPMISKIPKEPLLFAIFTLSNDSEVSEGNARSILTKRPKPLYHAINKIASRATLAI